MSEDGREPNGHFAAGNPGKPKGAISRATKFKNLIYDIIEKRADELSREDILQIAKVASKFVPREIALTGELKHTGFIENMIKKADALKEEQEGADGD